MKTLLIAIILSFTMVTQVEAQNATTAPTVAGDTVITSSSKDTVVKVIRATAGYQTFSIQTVATKISGTVSGKVYLSGSLDGVNYQVTDSSAALANQTTNSVFFIKEYTPYPYYKIEARTADGSNSTQSVAYKFLYLFRRYATNN